MHIGIRSVNLVRWLARLLSGALLLFWGAFFLEHLSWFVGRGGPAPPAFVWAAQGLHLLLLVGYALSFKWELAGSALILLGAVLFFALTGASNAPVFILLSVTPALLYLLCQFARGAGLSTPVAK